MQGGYRYYSQCIAIRGEAMNFPKLNTKKAKQITVSDFLNSEDTENIAFSKDGVSTRPALYLSGGIVNESDATKQNSFNLTNAVVFNGGKYNRLTVHFCSLGSYTYRYSFSLVTVMGEIAKAGTIEYSSGSDGIIRIPQSVFCFSAKAFKGSGVFAFINLSTNNAEGSQFDIYELSSDFKSWLKVSEEEMYIPTYYINGRGSLYNLFEDDLDKPEYLESLNMLNGICNCYFTTDNFSNNFYLPIKSASYKDAHISAELMVDINTTLYFTFPKNAFVSNNAQYNGHSISLAYNGGFLQIMSSSGYVPQHIYGRPNNFKVTIKHETQEQYNSKAYMTNGSLYQLSNEGSQVVLTGNSKYPSLTFVSYPDNPLYFPENLKINSGNDTSAVKATASFKDKLLIFKEDGIYKADVKKDGVTQKQICSGTGIKWGSSIAANENYVIFMGTDSKFYAIMPDYTVKEISGGMYKYTKLIFYPNTVFSVLSYSRYMLFIDSTAFVLDLKVSDKALNKPIWSRWTYPDDLKFVDGFSVGDDIGYICKTSNEKYVRYYPAMTVDRDEDFYFMDGNFALARKSVFIKSKLKTTFESKDNKCITKIFRKVTLICNSTDEITVTFIGDNGAITKTLGIEMYCDDNEYRSINLYPLLRSRKCTMEIEALYMFNLRGVTVEYYEIAE